MFFHGVAGARTSLCCAEGVWSSTTMGDFSDPTAWVACIWSIDHADAENSLVRYQADIVTHIRTSPLTHIVNGPAKSIRIARQTRGI